MAGGAVAAIGMFDGVHRGHQFLIGRLADEAHSRGLKAVAVTFPRHPLALIAPQREPAMLTSPSRKYDLLLQAGADEVMMLSFTPELRSLTAAQFMGLLREKLGVERLMVGYDHRFGSDSPAPGEYVVIGRKEGVEVVEAPNMPTDSENVSSSMIRRELALGNVEKAAEALGRNYRLEGVVVAGKQLGRTINFPTANLQPDSAMMLPAEGVYACRAILADGTEKAAMVNLGRRPTVDAAGAPLSVEAHLIDFDGNLYDAPLALDFVSRLRGERKFDSLAELKQQLAADREAAKQISKSKKLADS